MNPLLRWWHDRDTDRRIRKHGWTAIYVGDYASAPTWVYTVGIGQRLGQPELVIFDVPKETAAELLWRAFNELKEGILVLEDGKPWLTGETDNPLVWRRVHQTQVESPTGWFTLAVERRALHAGRLSTLEVFQLVLSDGGGRLPWEPGYEEGLRARQPALYLPLTDYGDVPLSPPEREALRIADEHGWSMMLVRADPQWAYTIGMAEVGAPEIVAFLPADTAANLLHEAQGQLTSGELRLEDGLSWTIREVNACWRKVDESQYMGLNVFRLAKLRHEQKVGRREAVDAYQLFLPDHAGRYPWEPGCDKIMRDMQPLLFEPFTPHPPKIGPLARIIRS